MSLIVYKYTYIFILAYIILYIYVYICILDYNTIVKEEFQKVVEIIY